MKVIMIAAITLCGRISPAPLGSILDRRFLEKMRDRTDASLMGSGTLRHDNPQMAGSDGLSQHRMRCFISASGDIPVQGKKVFASGPQPIIFTGPDNNHLSRHLAGKAEVVYLSATEGFLAIGEALSELSRRGVESVLIEGGAGLNFHALRQQVVDEVMVTITPQISGDRQAATLADGNGAVGSPFVKLQCLSCEQAVTGEVFVHYSVCYEEENA